MAATVTQIARIRQQAELLLTKLRNVIQVRADVTSMGGEAFLSPVLDGDPDPVPDLSAAQLIAAMQALAAVNNALADNSELHRKSLLARSFPAEVAVARSRSAIRELREALTVFRQLQVDLADSANGEPLVDYLTAQSDATTATQVVAEFAALTAIDATLNAGAGSRRKDLNRASD